jgi:hypothetical protein
MKKYAILLFILLLVFTLTGCDEDKTDPVISGVEDITIEIGDSFNVMNGITAEDNKDGDITAEITYTITDNIGNLVSIDLTQEGVYNISYRVEDNAGNSDSAMMTLTIVAPQSTITFSGITDHSITNDEVFDPLVGVTALDDIEGDYTSNIEVTITDASNNALTNYENIPAGTYVIIYSVYSSNDTLFEETASLTVTDVVAPVFTMESELVEIYIGDDFDPFDYVTVMDETDGDLSSVTVVTYYESGTTNVVTLDTSVEFDYLVSMTVSDAAMNEQTFTFALNVIEPEPVLFTVTDAEARLNQFFDDVIFSTMTVEELCDLYIGDVPFPVNGTYSECMEGVPQIQAFLTAYSVTNVLPETLEDGTHYYADVTLTDVDNNEYTFTVEFVFMGYPNGTVSYIHFVDDPFHMDGGGGDFLDLTIGDAEMYLNDFYAHMIDVDYDLQTFCETYFMDSISNDGTVQDCIDGLANIRGYVIDHVIDWVDFEQINPPEGGSINGYRAQITVITMDDTHVFEVLFAFIEVNNQPYLILLSNPFGEGEYQPGGYIAFVDMIDAEVRLNEFYDDILYSSMTDVEICDKYIGDVPFPINAPYDQCIESMPYVRAYYTGHVLNNLYYEDLNDGRHYFADITLTTVDNETVDLTVEFVFLTDTGLTETYIHMIGDPFHMDGGGGPQFITVSIEDAEMYLDEFYIYMIDVNYDLQMFCEIYVMDSVTNDQSLQECIDGFNNIRGYVVTHQIDLVEPFVIYPPEGDPIDGYRAVLNIITIDETVQIEIFFGFIDVDGPYLVLFSNPMGGQDDDQFQYGGFIDFVDEIDALQRLDDFYTDVLLSPMTEAEVCDKYIGNVPFPINSNYEECVEFIPYVRDYYIDFMIHNISYQDLDDGRHYYADVTLTTINNEMVDFNIEFIFLTDVGLTENYIHMMSDPFQLDGPHYLQLSLEDAELVLEQFYIDMLDPTLTANDICDIYVMNSPIHDGTYDECLYGVDYIKTIFLSYQINSIATEMVYPPDGKSFEAYKVNITLTYTNDVFNIDVYFVFYGDATDPQIVLLSDPFNGGGMGEGPEIVVLPLPDAYNILDAFYRDLFDDAVDPYNWCNMYMMYNNMYPYDIEYCAGYVLDVRTTLPFYSIDSLDFAQVPAGDSTIEGYEAVITFTHDGNVTTTISLYLAFVDDGAGNPMIYVFTDDPVAGSPSGSQYADLDIPTAQGLIEAYYLDLMDMSLPSSGFCQMYLLLGIDMQSMMELDCVPIRDDYMANHTGHTFSVDAIDFYAGTNDSPPYFMTTITRSDGVDSYTYQAGFIFLLDPNGNPLLATPFMQSLGEMNEGGPVFIPVTLQEATDAINNFYFMLMDPNLDGQAACDFYLANNPYFTPDECELFGLYNFLTNYMPYAIDNITEIVVDGHQEWLVDISELAPDGPVPFQVTFMFVEGSNGLPVLMYTSPPFGITPTVVMVNDVTTATLLLQQYYSELFDASVSTEDFCNYWVITNPFYEGTVQDCYDGRAYALSMNETYTVQNVYFYGDTPFTTFEAEISVYDPDTGNVMIYLMDFFIWDDGGMMHLVLMDEVVREVPLP